MILQHLFKTKKHFWQEHRRILWTEVHVDAANCSEYRYGDRLNSRSLGIIWILYRGKDRMHVLLSIALFLPYFVISATLVLAQSCV